MSIKIKLLGMLTLVVAGITAGLLAISALVLQPTLSQVEAKEVTNNVERATTAISDTLGQLNNKLEGWSIWDETYKYAKDRNQAYVETNLSPYTYAALGINYIMYYNNAGQVLYSGGIDPATGEAKRIPTALTGLFAPGSALLKHADATGKRAVVMTSSGPVLFASLPIWNQAKQGPFAGTIVFAQDLNEAKIEQLAKLTHLNLKYYPYDGALDSQTQAVKSGLTEQSTVVKPVDEKTIAGYGLIKDANNQPALIARVEQPRTLFAQGKSGLNTLTLATIAMGILVLALTLGLLRQLILARLKRLSGQVNLVNTQNDVGGVKVSDGSKDEIGRLTGALNGMFDRIRQAVTLEQRKVSLEEQVKERTAGINQQMQEIERINKVMADRDSTLEQLTKQLANKSSNTKGEVK